MHDSLPPACARRRPGFGLALCVLACVGQTLAGVAVTASEPPLFGLAEGDRVVLVGSTLIERWQSYDYLETRLTARYAGARLVFRNLGWSGDTVFGHARAGFETEQEGYQRLVERVREARPTVLVVGYGTNESFAGEGGLEGFAAGLRRLLDDCAPAGTRVVLLSPLKQEDLGRPLPDPATHNADVKRYCDLIAQIAAERGCVFVDLFTLLGSATSGGALTQDGLQLSPFGYWYASAAVEQALGLPNDPWQCDIDLTSGSVTLRGTRVHSLSLSDRELSAELQDVRLPQPPRPVEGPPAIGGRRLRVAGLAPGRYQLCVDDTPQLTADSLAWAQGVELTSGPEIEQVDRLRQAIEAKNRLYFYRWRPQNETYLFGFRKHEQGNNAVEVPQFDPLIEEAERRIAELAQPLPHRYTLRRESEETTP